MTQEEKNQTIEIQLEPGLYKEKTLKHSVLEQVEGIYKDEIVHTAIFKKIDGTFTAIVPVETCKQNQIKFTNHQVNSTLRSEIEKLKTEGFLTEIERSGNEVTFKIDLGDEPMIETKHHSFVTYKGMESFLDSKELTSASVLEEYFLQNEEQNSESDEEAESNDETEEDDNAVESNESANSNVFSNSVNIINND